MQGFPLSPRTPLILLILQSWGSRVLEDPSPGGDPRIPCPPGTQEGTQALFPTLQPWVLDGRGDPGTHCPSFAYPLPAMGLWPRMSPSTEGKVPCLPGTDLSAGQSPPVPSHGVGNSRHHLPSGNPELLLLPKRGPSYCFPPPPCLLPGIQDLS